MNNIPNEFQPYICEQLAQIDQLRSDADRRRKELYSAPKLWGIEVWKVAIAGCVVSGIIGGIIGYMLATIPPAPIVIQLKEPPNGR